MAVAPAKAGAQSTRLNSGFRPQGAGRRCEAAKALKDSDPLWAKADVESYAATTTLRRNDETSNLIVPDQ